MTRQVHLGTLHSELPDGRIPNRFSMLALDSVVTAAEFGQIPRTCQRNRSGQLGLPSLRHITPVHTRRSI